MNTFACMQMLFATLPEEINELIRFCKGQSPTYSMSILLVLSQMADHLQEQVEATSSPKSSAKTPQLSSFWNELIIRSVMETKAVLKQLTVRFELYCFSLVGIKMK